MPTHQIHPQEFHVLVDRYEIRTRCPKEQFKEAMVLRRIRHANLHAGDTVRVMCMTHDRDTVLHVADFLVYHRSETIHREDVDERTERQVNDIDYRIVQVMDWISTPEAKDAPKAGEASVAWNPGKRVHEVVDADGDTVLAAYSKEDGGKEAATAFLKDLQSRSEAA